MDKPRILLQLDPDRHASVFDAVVAVDAEVQHLLQYSQVRPDDVQGLVHGAMFTRGPADLHRTAVFIGGADVAAGEELLRRVTGAFFGPLRVSVMLDANGANTTAAAAVLAVARHLDLAGAEVLILAGTGPVGRRAARLLAGRGASVRLASRSLERADQACGDIRAVLPQARLVPVQAGTPGEAFAALGSAAAVIAAGAAGVELLPSEALGSSPALQVAIDLNAVSPAGIPGIQVSDKAAARHGVACYGAIGVGGTKMKIHKAALRRLFESNDLVLDAEQIFALGQELERSS